MERFFGGPNTDELDAVIRGTTSGDPVVERLVEKLREVAVQPPSDASMAVHIATAARAARRAAVSAGDAAAPVVPARRRGKFTRGRRRAAYAGFTSGLVAKFLFGAVALAAVAGGTAAATGTLPDSLQNSVSSIAERVGIALPAGDEIPEVVADPGERTNNANERGAAAQERAAAFASAVNEWAKCVKEREAGEDGEKPTPQEACGEHPNPKDFGVPATDNGKPDDPGKDSAPGQNKDDTDPPGNSGDAPGQNNDKGNKAEGEPPGKSGDAPGRNEPPGRGSGGGQGNSGGGNG